MLTKEERIKLLMLNNADWANFKRDARVFFKTPGNEVPAHLELLVSLTYRQWLDTKKELDTLRETKKDLLEAKRRQLKAAEYADRKRDYMRNYMRRRREQERAEGSSTGSGTSE